MTVRRGRTRRETPALAAGWKQRGRHDPGRGELSGLKWAVTLACVGVSSSWEPDFYLRALGSDPRHLHRIAPLFRNANRLWTSSTLALG
jgi:hypothetical protein